MPDPVLDIAAARRSLRDSACPSLFRLAPARDGGICRLKLPFGLLDAAPARAIADAARRCGSGVIDVTNRANLQLRGIAPAREAALIDALLAAGLGPDHPDADDLRNVMTSPTAGLDPAQHANAHALARALLAAVATADAGRTLSPKLGFLVDGGEAVAPLDRAHDIWLSCVDHASTAIGFAGAPPVQADDATPFLVVDIHRAVDVVLAALDRFSQAAVRDDTIVRLKDLFARQPRAAFVDALAAQPGVSRGETWRRRAPVARGHVGVRDQRDPDRVVIGAVPSLGRVSSATLVALATIAETHGDGTLRLTPWQSVMVPGVRRATATAVQAALAEAGLVTDPGHPLASMVACSGITGCLAGRSDTKANARDLAARLAAQTAPLTIPLTIHVSGCEKRCAARRATDATLIAEAPGTYTLWRGDAVIGRSLDIAAAAARLAARP